MNEKEQGIQCEKCGISLIDKEIEFKYLEVEFTATAPCCPQCGQVFLSEEIVLGKLSEIEQMLEDK